MQKVFVYGTLRPAREGVDPVLTCNSRTVCGSIDSQEPAFMHGRLYSVGSFPAVYTAPCIDEKVYGDLLTVTDDAIERMDSLEGHPVFFRRQLVTVHTENGEVEAWVYMGPQRFVQLLGARLPRIESGNWFDVQP